VNPGDLVKITRPSIGIPKDTLGLVSRQWETDYDVSLIEIILVGSNRKRRYFSSDLLKVN
jgi:hypothetical protein